MRGSGAPAPKTWCRPRSSNWYGSVPPPDNLLPWLYRVVRNAAIDASRAARRRHRYETAASESTPKWFAPSYDPTGLDAQAAAASLADLPAETREIIVAHLWGGLTFEQIAQAVGSSAATCYRRYAAGLDTLRQKLGAARPAHLT